MTGKSGTKHPFAIAAFAANLPKVKHRNVMEMRQINRFSTATTASTASFGVPSFVAGIKYKMAYVAAAAATKRLLPFSIDYKPSGLSKFLS
ncbi:MAG: hypothetical protein LCI00_30405 [Chloroflexi bacterium]|nr:hypothetical protein [Chloroflexota bacterium]